MGCTPLLELSGAYEGFGHRFGMLMFGLDAAARTGAQLVLPDDFWAGHGLGSRRDHRLHGYPWAWALFPFANSSSVQCARRSRHSFDSVEAYLAWAAAAPSTDTGACRRLCAHLDTGNGKSCRGKWCFESYEGAWDRSAQLLARAMADGLRHRSLEPPAPQTDRPASVIWHLRTGDNPLLANLTAFQMVKVAIDAGFRRRGCQHHILTFDETQLFSMYPGLRNLGFHTLRLEDGLPTLSAMATAEILVSTGSSYAQSAAALAKPGRQLHIYFPPKELGTVYMQSTTRPYLARFYIYTI